MPVDISQTLQMLAQPRSSGVIEGLTQGFANFQAQRQAAMDRETKEAKRKLEEKVLNQEISMNELESIGKRGEIMSGVAQGVLTAQDPMIKQQILTDAAPMLKQAGITDEQLQAGMQNLNNPQFWTAIVTQNMAAKDFLSLHQGTSKKPTAAARQTQELIQAAKDRGEYTPAYDKVAEGIGYNTYQWKTDDQGNTYLFDTRTPGQPVSEDVVGQVSPHVPKTPGGEYKVEPVIKGTRVERERAKAVKDLSDDMGKTGAPRLENILSRIEAALSPAISKKGEVVGDIPGYGATAALPDWAITREGQDLRQDLVKLFNIELAERSGAAVTKQELDRLRDEFKAGMFKTDRQLVQGIRNYRSLLEDYKKAVFAGYGEDVKDQYWGQGGLNFKMDKPPSAPTPPRPQAVTEDQIRADQKKYGWSDEETEAAIKQYVR